MSLSQKRYWFVGIIYVLFFLHVFVWHSLGIKQIGHLGFGEFFGFLGSGVVTAGTIFSILVFVHALFFGGLFCGWLCHWGILQDFIAGIYKKIGVKPRMVRIDSRIIPWLWFLIILGQTGMVWASQGFPSLITFNIGATAVWSGVPRSILLICLTTIISGFLLVYLFGERAFCRTICTFRLWFAWFEKVARYKVARKAESAICSSAGCSDECSRACPMGIDVAGEAKNIGYIASTECVKCMICIDECPAKVLETTYNTAPICNTVASDYSPPKPEFESSAVFFASLVSALALIFLAGPIGGNVSMSLGFVLGFFILRTLGQGKHSLFEICTIVVLVFALYFRSDFNDASSLAKGLTVITAFLIIVKLFSYSEWESFITSPANQKPQLFLLIFASISLLIFGGKEINAAWGNAKFAAAEKSGDYKGLSCMLESHIKMNEADDQNIRLKYVESLVKTNETEKALKILNEMASSTPSDKVFAWLADIHRESNNEAEREKYLEHGLLYYPDSSIILSQAAMFELDHGNIKNAETHSRKCLTINSDDFFSHVTLGIVLFKQGQMEDSEREFQIALGLNEKKGLPHIGRFYLGVNRPKDAEKHLLKAADLQNSDPSILFDLGIAYAQQEKISDAVKAWEKVLEIDPKHDIARENIKAAHDRMKKEK
ncbi:MAG: tetratricopeptide repeat protein [Candidatus Riflebacteria bacterium]|nr:tetratricopeptide repeat protein [Candidatus Riflebacteria bacterium]